MNFVKTSKLETVINLRSKLYKKLTAPIDAMWELLYIASAQNYLIVSEGINIGYSCIDDSKSLVQVYLDDDKQMNKVIESLIRTKLITSAKLSSNEPVSFNTCLFHSTSINTNTICFQHTNNPLEVGNTLDIKLVTEADISDVKAFFKEQIGMNDTFGYTENLVERKEIYFVKESGLIIATSECRMSDTQPEIADLGIIVNKNKQGQGIATQVMRLQVNRVLEAGRKPICSTTLDNTAARKAIEKAEFYCTNIIFDIDFNTA